MIKNILPFYVLAKQKLVAMKLSIVMSDSQGVMAEG
jgi:hypothetical protein